MRREAVRSVVRMLVDMLGVNVVTTDMQLLMGKETGSVLFVNMTEAHVLSTSSDPDAASAILLISTIPFTLSWSTHREQVVKERVENLVESGGRALCGSCCCATYRDNKVRVVYRPFRPPPYYNAREQVNLFLCVSSFATIWRLVISSRSTRKTRHARPLLSAQLLPRGSFS